MNGAQNETQQGAYTEAQLNQGHPIPPAGHPGVYDPVYEVKLNPNANRKSPLVATLLSMMPGLGQIYVGYYQQGFINMFVVAGTIAILSSSVMRGAEPFFGVFLSFFWIYQMIDANRRAQHYNRVKAGLGGEEVPEGFEMPTTKGSMLGGAILILIGVLFILDLNFDVSMEWIENWWPLILVLVGINLVWKARKKSG
jgi:TM2 domain-containing membrane protein YozV